MSRLPSSLSSPFVVGVVVPLVAVGLSGLISWKVAACTARSEVGEVRIDRAITVALAAQAGCERRITGARDVLARASARNEAELRRALSEAGERHRLGTSLLAESRWEEAEREFEACGGSLQEACAAADDEFCDLTARLEAEGG